MHGTTSYRGRGASEPAAIKGGELADYNVEEAAPSEISEEAAPSEITDDDVLPAENEAPILCRCRADLQDGRFVVFSSFQTLQEWQGLARIRAEVEARLRLRLSYKPPWRTHRV